ncbi:MAG: tail fiber protein [Pyrinomonadaceae bacterium]
MDEYIGIIKMFGGNFAPRGWALCNGQLMSIAQNSALFSILGTTYGGDGVTTFALPNMQSRVPVHAGTGPGLSNYQLGEVGGTESTTLNSTQVPPHIHTFSLLTAEGDPNSKGTNNAYLAGQNSNFYNTAQDGTKMASQTTDPNAGGNQPVPIIQPILCVNFIICTEGLYPSRN